MSVITLKEIHVKDLVAFWNHNLGDNFPMSVELFQQNTLQDMRLDDDGSFVVTNDDNAIMAAVATKTNAKQPDTAWIQFLLVGKEYRSQGLGTNILATIEKMLMKKGVRQVFLGRDMNHYFPGIPADDLDSISWFEAKGFEGHDKEYDMVNHYDATSKKSVPESTDIEFNLIKTNEFTELLDFMEAAFPGRWAEELRTYIKQGGNGREFIVAKKAEKIIGFCRINDTHSKIIAPNLYWEALIDGKTGGLGPLGIAENERGNGYGLAIVEAGIAELRARDIQSIIIDWTGLVDFYKKLGYEPWKAYRAYSKSF